MTDFPETLQVVFHDLEPQTAGLVDVKKSSIVIENEIGTEDP